MSEFNVPVTLRAVLCKACGALYAVPPANEWISACPHCAYMRYATEQKWRDELSRRCASLERANAALRGCLRRQRKGA